MSATSMSNVIKYLAQNLAEALRDGREPVADARVIEHSIREAEGWLQAARRFLDPGDPLSQGGHPDG